MKIGIFTDSYKPYTSGVVTSICTFKEELAKLGHEIYVFAPNYPDYREKEENVFRFYSLPSPTNPDYALAIPVYPGINVLLKKLDLDIIHVHSPFLLGRVGLRYAKRYHIPLLFTYHTMYDQYAHYVPLAQDLAKEMAVKYSNYFCNQCDHVIVPSTDVKEMLEGYHIKTPISVIPTGVPLHKFTGKKSNWLRDKYKVPKDNKILLFVGRLTKEKNLSFLIEAFKQVKKSLANTTLVLTAQGPLEDELKKLTYGLGLSLDTEVIFTGALPFDTLVDVYYSADLFVFSSVTETQGLVLIEAMAAGLPVVAISASGVLDMVDSGINGILTAEDHDEFSKAIIKILSTPELYEKYQANAIIKAEELSAANTTKSLHEVYEDLYHEKYRPRRSRVFDFGSWFGS
ncbi:MAG TPA: glycosyltransferase family 4 protein [Syntrophomonadaceae bacterium]|nr:glycosyltransferase family 4 protein [Syntrophomonadaceae bacterium]